MDSMLISAGVAAALAAAGYAGSRTASRGVSRPKGRSARKNQSRTMPSTSTSGYQPENRADLTIRPPNPFNVPKRIPRNVAALVAWDTVKFDSQISVSATTFTETNFSFNLSQHPQASSWTALFDQWTIPQVSITFWSSLAPGSVTGPCQFHTALDFDNITNIGSIAAIEDFSSCNSVAMQPQTRFVRSVRPSARSYSTSGGSGNNALIVGPQWVDAAVPGVPFFGIRTIASSAGASYGIDATVTIWFCFKNQI
jgi:hypothetical protein